MTGPVVLQIDAGNSGAKWRRVQDGAVLDRGTCDLRQEGFRADLALQAKGADAIWVASVLAPELDQILSACLEESAPGRVCRASAVARHAGVVNSYAEPERMGVDRWLVLLAARRRCAGRVCIVDAGTALTIDFLGANGHHEGGYIVPGPALMESALFSGTGRVRDSQPERWSLTPGTSTAAAVRAGISASLAGALQAAMQAGTVQGPVEMLVTGGYAQELLATSGLTGTWAPDLVFEGLEIALQDSS